jgi:hypothetical protein
VATRCPHCGHAFFRDPYEETRYEPRTRLGPILVAVGLLAAAGVGMWAVSRQGPLGPGARTTPVTTRAPAPAPAAIDTSPAARPEPAPITALALEAAPPADTPPAPPAREVARASRWASTWANVREAPDLSAPVVRVLDPGEQVEVGERDQGYWRVYVDGRPVGYVAASLLLREPPVGID